MINENDPIAQMKKDLTDDKFSLRAFMEEKYYNPKYHILLSHAALSRNELSIVLFFEHFLILCGFFNEENTHNLMEINVNTELYYNKEKINAEIDLRLLYKIPSHKFSFRYMMLVLALEAKNVPSMENAVETKKMSAQVTGEMLAAAQHDLLTALPSHLGLTQSGCLVSDAWRNALKKVKASVVVWGVTCRKTPGMDADIFVQIYRAKISAEDVLNLYDGAPLTPNHEILESVVYQFFEESSRMSLLDTMHQVRENIRSQPIPIMAEVDGKTLIGKDAMNAILKQHALETEEKQRKKTKPSKK